MRRAIYGSLAAAMVMGMVMPASAAGGDDRYASATGIARVGGREVVVDVVVAVARGGDDRSEARKALEAQGARPIGAAGIGSTGFQATGFLWTSLPVAQHYNPSGERADAKGAMAEALATWNDAPTSSFQADLEADTTRCPSLVRECPGPQSFDGNNDIGWARMSGSTLAVTWYGTSTQEADMAFNTRYSWNTGCTTSSGSYDVQTVAIHEQGHVAGLGHYETSGSIMRSVYGGVQCSLGGDDVEGITYLYPTQRATVAGTVSDGTSGIAGATVSLGGTGLSATANGSGTYEITGVPFPVTYDITASASGFSGASLRETVTSSSWSADFTLEPSGGGGGGGGGPPCDKKPSHPKC